jgi:hypothetical protein
MTDDATLRPIRHAIEVLRADGHPDSQIAETLLAAGADAVQQVYGVRELSRQLYMMAMKLAQEADALEHAIAEGSAGKPN